MVLNEAELQLFESKFLKGKGCWNWLGRHQKGTGVFRRGKLFLGAHRVAYEQYLGPIPEGMCVYRTCKNHNCVNPEHLKLGPSPSVWYGGETGRLRREKEKREQAARPVTIVNVRRGRIMVEGQKQRPRCPQCSKPLAGNWTNCPGCQSQIIWEEK